MNVYVRYFVLYSLVSLQSLLESRSSVRYVIIFLMGYNNAVGVYDVL